MKNRSGFTLMELLLVVAILAIVAAVAAPQFFRTSTQSVDETRKALFKANYQAMKSAINMQLWDEINKNLPTAKRMPTGNSAQLGLARLKILIENGYLQESASTFENERGQKRVFVVRHVGGQTAAAPTGAASAPVFMDSVPLYLVGMILPETGGSFEILGLYSIDELLKSGKSWDEIWAAAKLK